MSRIVTGAAKEVLEKGMDREDKEIVHPLLAEIVESSDDAIISKTLQGIITSWNKSAERILGYTAEEAIGQPVLMLIPPELHEKEEVILSKLKRGERIKHYETTRVRKDGKRLEVSLTVSPIKNQSGTIIGASKILRDITEQRRAERAAQETASRLSLALRAAQMGDWSWDIRTDLVTLSERAAEIFGIPPGRHLTWKEIRELLHPEDRDEARRQVDQAVNDHTDYDIEYRVVQPSGKQLWVAAQGRAVYDNNEPVGMLGIVRDITQMRDEKVRLEEETEALEIINRVGQLFSAELDQERLVQALTDAATEITGAQFGSFFYNVIDEQGRSYMLHAVSGIPREHFAHFPMPEMTDLFGPTFRRDGIVRIADVNKDPRYGTSSPYFAMPRVPVPVTSYLAVPVVSRSGQVIGGLFFGHSLPNVFTDRHERIVTGLAGLAATAMDSSRLYETARRAQNDAETANRLKDEFLATVSHELRSPLNAIFGWARILRSGKLDQNSFTRGVEIIERNARLQGQIIEDILDVSRIITGKLRLELTPVDAASVIETAIDSLRPTADARGVKVQAKVAAESTFILADASRLQQIIWNLLSNAIKFTPRDGKVEVNLESVDSYIEIQVKDTGRGINKDFLPFIFDRFRQADSSTTRGFGGLGLGLAIVRHLTELHGGTVTAESTGEGLGATFTVRLPLPIGGRAELSSKQLWSHGYQQPSAGNIAMEFSNELTGVRVLVVDDEEDARELLTTMLRQYGAEVRAADSARAGIEVMKSWHPNLLLSDIAMPGEDGYAFIRKVRSLTPEEGGETLAIALTAYARSEDRLKALRSGYQAHISKPVEPTELAASIVGLVRSSTGVKKSVHQ